MDLLIISGTVFLGRTLVDAALARERERALLAKLQGLQASAG